jgi:hypothetical protein
MAKIKYVSLLSIPEIINVGDDISDITVVTKIEFHPLDIKMEMDYLLYVFVYDIHGNVDTPVIIENWDESNVFGVSESWKDDFLGKKVVEINCKEERNVEINTPIALHLGKLTKNSSHHSKKLEVFASLIPAVGRASKWSKPFESDIIF